MQDMQERLAKLESGASFGAPTQPVDVDAIIEAMEVVVPWLSDELR